MYTQKYNKLILQIFSNAHYVDNKRIVSFFAFLIEDCILVFSKTVSRLDSRYSKNILIVY